MVCFKLLILRLVLFSMLELKTVILNFSEIMKFVRAHNDKHLWVGITNSKTDRRWRFSDGSTSPNWVLDWNPGEPNYVFENCAIIVAKMQRLNNNICSQTSFAYNGLERYQAECYGFCEKTLWVLIKNWIFTSVCLSFLLNLVVFETAFDLIIDHEIFVLV